MITLPIPLERIRTATGLAKMLGRADRDAAFVEAKNQVIAGTFTASDIASIAARYRVNLAEVFEDEWRSLLVEILFHFALDARFSDEEKQFIQEYARAFQIDRETMDLCYRKATGRAFTVIVARMVEGGSLSDTDARTIELLAKRLGIDSAQKMELWREVVKNKFDEVVKSVIEDGLVSDEEYNSLQRLIKNLRIDLSNRLAFEQSLEWGRARWKAMYGELDCAAFPDLRLKADERVYFRGRADWYEHRKVRSRVDYAGLSGRFRVAKGLSFRYGSIGYQAPAQDAMVKIASGQIVMTNRRVLLLSDVGDNKSLNWSTALAINLNSHNEFEIEKERGKSPVIDVTEATFGHRFLAGEIAQRLLTGVQ